MNQSLIGRGTSGNLERWAICLIVIGCIYVILDPIERHFIESQGLWLFGYKPILDTARDFTFALSAIIGGVLLLKKDNKGWFFTCYFSLGFLITMIINISFSFFKRCNTLDQFFLIQIFALIILIRFWSKLMKSKYTLLISLVILMLNLIGIIMLTNIIPIR